jgi:hypothetical protein
MKSEAALSLFSLGLNQTMDENEGRLCLPSGLQNMAN